MTATEKRIDEMLKTTDEMELQALIELVHESYFFAYWENAELSLENFMERDTGANIWRISDVQNDKSYDCFSIRECYETIYFDILEKTFEDELKREREEEAEREWEAEERDRADLKKWLNEQGGVAYGKY